MEELESRQAMLKDQTMKRSCGIFIPGSCFIGPESVHAYLSRCQKMMVLEALQVSSFGVYISIEGQQDTETDLMVTFALARSSREERSATRWVMLEIGHYCSYLCSIDFALGRINSQAMD